MNQIVFLLISVHFIQSTNSQVDTTACSATPLTCFLPAYARDYCDSDADCGGSEYRRCCYKSCYKQCVKPNPCSNVVCKSGYLCQVVSTPCTSTLCNKEPSCLPAVEVNCPTNSNYSDECADGYKQDKDRYGCPIGPCKSMTQCYNLCRIMCTHGQELDAKGCPTCQCKPVPSNPCSDNNCRDTEECRILALKPVIKTLPAPLQAVCAPYDFIPSVIDKSCSMRKATTIGLPILNITGKEIDCATTSCPPHSVCVTIASNMHRCCWQHSQLVVTTGPKVGQCPPSPMIRRELQTQKCEVDANCPGTLKCCYINRERGKTEHVGICLPPIHITLNEENLCLKNDGTLWFFQMLGIC